jgi:NAD(P)H-hydrate epimerase
MRVLNASQMREVDCRTIDVAGVSSTQLMEDAGRQVVEAMLQQWPTLLPSHVSVVGGKGNNGGDGFVVARLLAAIGVDVSVYLLSPVRDIEGDAGLQLSRLKSVDVAVHQAARPEEWRRYIKVIAGSDVIVDALLGTGLARPLGGHFRTVVNDLNACDVPIVSIDIPSGLSADTASLIGESIVAKLTIALGAPKLPLLMLPAAARVGKVVVADIGIPDFVIDSVSGPSVNIVTREWARTLVAPRQAGMHKGDCGRVLLVAGSTGKTGAACLAGLGALRSGAGLVKVATPRSCQPIVSAWMPEYMTLGLDEAARGTLRAESAEDILEESCDVLAMGPGLGRGKDVSDFVRTLVKRSVVPLVLDADALNVFSGDTTGLCGKDDRDLIITPHPGEMARLVGMPIEEVQAHRIDIARDFAAAHQLIVVLKGARTVVATPDGTVWINGTGNPGMATGGTGDVLTGVIAAWLCQMKDAATACCLGVFLHGFAGDLAAAKCGEVALIASDMGRHFGPALLDLLDPSICDELVDVLPLEPSHLGT